MILNKINSDSNLIALTSHLVILEITSIVRKKIVAKKKINGNISINDKENKQELKSTIDKLTREFIDHITRWEFIGKLQIVKTDESLTNIKKGAKNSKGY